MTSQLGMILFLECSENIMLCSGNPSQHVRSCDDHSDITPFSYGDTHSVSNMWAQCEFKMLSKVERRQFKYRSPDRHSTSCFSTLSQWLRLNAQSLFQVKSSQVEIYCHSATCVDIQWDEMSCLTGPRCYINTDIQHEVKQYKPIHKLTYCQVWLYICYI